MDFANAILESDGLQKRFFKVTIYMDAEDVNGAYNVGNGSKRFELAGSCLICSAHTRV